MHQPNDNQVLPFENWVTIIQETWNYWITHFEKENDYYMIIALKSGPWPGVVVTGSKDKWSFNYNLGVRDKPEMSRDDLPALNEWVREHLKFNHSIGHVAPLRKDKPYVNVRYDYDEKVTFNFHVYLTPAE